MTIHLPVELETSVAAIVESGRFASIDDAMAEAARLLIRDAKNGQGDAAEPADPISGLWHDCPDEIDEIVADAYRQRQADARQGLDVE